MKKLLGLVLVFPFAACGTDSQQGPETLPDLVVPKAPTADKGFQIITPIFEDVEPGMDYEVCTWTDVITDHDIDVRSTLGYQNEPPGHHIIMFYTTQRQPAGTQRVCNDSDMATFRFLAGAGSNGEINEAPGNLVYHVPAGAQIVVNHHYLNATEKVLRGQSVANAYYADPGGNYTPSGNLAVVNTDLQVQEGDTTQTMHAVLDHTIKFWYFAPHMHQWGKHTVVKITQAGNQQTEFDLDWDPSYAFHPPEKRLDPNTPMILNPGDMIDVSCEWNNTAGRVLTFGFEMCVAFGNTVDDQGLGNIAWDNGSWVPF